MEFLNTDEKIEILKNLTVREILNVGSTSKSMSKICKNKRYNPLWRRKILEDFSLDYKEEADYTKYRNLKILHNTDIYILKIQEGRNHKSPLIFEDRNKAVNYIIKSILDDQTFYSEEEEEEIKEKITYRQIKNSFATRNSIEYLNVLYFIAKIRTYNKKEERIDLLKEEEKYNLEREKIFSLYKGENIEEFKSELNNILWIKNPEKLNKRVEEFLETYNLHFHEEEIKTYVFNNLISLLY
jgi:hypothetical protein